MVYLPLNGPVPLTLTAAMYLETILSVCYIRLLLMKPVVVIDLYCQHQELHHSMSQCSQ